jgi:hypothetical protein
VRKLYKKTASMFLPPMIAGGWGQSWLPADSKMPTYQRANMTEPKSSNKFKKTHMLLSSTKDIIPHLPRVIARFCFKASGEWLASCPNVWIAAALEPSHKK